MLGGVEHKKGRISEDVGLRKTQEGKDVQAKLAEVEWAKTLEGDDVWEHARGSPDHRKRSHSPQVKPRLTAHAFRIT